MGVYTHVYVQECIQMCISFQTLTEQKQNPKPSREPLHNTHRFNFTCSDIILSLLTFPHSVLIFPGLALTGSNWNIPQVPLNCWRTKASHITCAKISSVILPQICLTPLPAALKCKSELSTRMLQTFIQLIISWVQIRGQRSEALIRIRIFLLLMDTVSSKTIKFL